MIVKEKDMDRDGINDFPQNRTLYADQFTDGGPLSDKDREGFPGTDLEQVFDHYKPEVAVELLTEEGELVVERFQFRNLDDFEDQPLIAQSRLLSEVEWKIEAFDGMIRHLERNKALHQTLADDARREELKCCMGTFLAELKGASKIASQEGFLMLKAIVKGIASLDPSRLAMRGVFLSDPRFAEERDLLRKELELWHLLLEKYGADLAGAVGYCATQRTETEQCLRRNLLTIRNEIHKLEVTYRTLDAFFAHAGDGSCQSVTFMNVSRKELGDIGSWDSTAVQKEMEKYYDRLELKDSYSLLVIPGYLGSASIVREWAKSAYKNKVVLVTDFEDIHGFIELKDALESAHVQGQDVFMANIIMTCNYILGRKKSELAEEDDDLCFPGSGALAGRMANTDEIPIAQGVVGKEYGALDSLQGTRLSLLKSEIEVLVNYGVIPIVEDDGHTMACSNRSLYNGSAISLQEYPIVRVFDWVKKVLMNYMHEIALETWDPYQSSQQLKRRIQSFLNHYQGYQHLYSNYKLGDPTQNPESKIVTVDISITPFYVGKNFMIKLTADEKRHITADTDVEG